MKARHSFEVGATLVLALAPAVPVVFEDPAAYFNRLRADPNRGWEPLGRN